MKFFRHVYRYGTGEFEGISYFYLVPKEKLSESMYEYVRNKSQRKTSFILVDFFSISYNLNKVVSFNFLKHFFRKDFNKDVEDYSMFFTEIPRNISDEKLKELLQSKVTNESILFEKLFNWIKSERY